MAYYKEIRPGLMEFRYYAQPLGRWFIRGREVYLEKNVSWLGDDYFLPPGTYGGRILK